MNISENTKQELKNLKGSYKNKEIDNLFFIRAINILNKEEYFSNMVKHYSANDPTLFIEVARDKILYNLSVIKRKIKILYNKTKPFDMNLQEFEIFISTQLIIHEFIHVWQNVLCAEKNISIYSEVNYLYMLIYEKFYAFNLRDKIMYDLLNNYHEKFCFERYANITAAKIAIELFDEPNINEWAKWKYIEYITNNGYYLRRGKVISPVERTLKYFRIKDDIIYNSNMPFEVLFDHGFKISSEDYHIIYDDILTGNRTSLDYDETVKKIKTLNNRCKINR